VGDTRILYKRFIEREILPERGQANMIGYEPSCEEFDLWCRHLDSFDVGGEIVVIDTTDFGMVDFKGHIETARAFIAQTIPQN
jgi:hypothetical protein